MFVGVCEVDLLLGDVHSLKEKRSVIRPLVRDLRRRFDVAVAETDYSDLHRRSVISVAAVSASARHCGEILDECEGWVAGLPEVSILGVRRRLFGGDDEGVRDGI